MTDNLHLIRSTIPGLTWPRLPDAAGSMELAMQYQLEQTQWWPAAELERHQLRQARLLLQHAADSVPFHHARLAAAGFDPAAELTLERFRALPRMSRRDIQARGRSLLSTAVPAEHGAVVSGETSGSTGAPITYYHTELTRLLFRASNLRDQLWHRRDLGLKLAAIRPDRGSREERGAVHSGWGASIEAAFSTGTASVLHSANTLDRQIEWLAAEDPSYLLTLASNLLELAREMRRRGVRLARLREAQTFGDALSPAARAECAALLGVKVTDMYTAQEAGYIALQCPEHEHYHVQSEAVLVEILGEDGRPCPPGASGKVVLTSLHNFAMPLIRYEIGDYAESGLPCPCGRGLPVISRLLGRERNLAVAPDGRRFYPSFAAEKWMHLAPVRQIQLVQKTRQAIEVRLVAARRIEAGEEDALRTALRQSLGHPYELSFVYLDAIPRTATGKYEDFLCEVAA